MIKAIIFDYGGVLSIENSLRSFGDMYAPKFGANAKDFNDLIIENWLEARTNKINSKLFWKRLANFLNTKEKNLRKDLMDFFGFREEVLELIKKLKTENYKLGLLSNQIEDWLEEVIKNHKLDQIFNVIITSYKSKVAKPELSIFMEIIKKLKVKSDECLYIDDREKNIIPAKKLGMKTILFKNHNQLIKDLKKLGIKW